MYKTYAGRVKDGRPVLTESVDLPENAGLIITVVEKPRELTEEERKAEGKRKAEAWERFFEELDSIEDEPITDEDLARFEKNRFSLRREIGV